MSCKARLSFWIVSSIAITVAAPLSWGIPVELVSFGTTPSFHLGIPTTTFTIDEMIPPTGSKGSSFVLKSGAEVEFLGTLNALGYTQYTITNFSTDTPKDFYVDPSIARVNVPEGGSAVALLGLAMAITLSLGRRCGAVSKA